MNDKLFVVWMVGVIVLGFVIAFVWGNLRVKKFRKIFGVDPGNSVDQVKANQPAIDGVIKEHRKRVCKIYARPRPKDHLLSEAYDIWEEERALAMMAFDDARALARAFGYFVGTDLDE